MPVRRRWRFQEGYRSVQASCLPLGWWHQRAHASGTWRGSEGKTAARRRQRLPELVERRGDQPRFAAEEQVLASLSSKLAVLCWKRARHSGRGASEPRQETTIRNRTALCQAWCQGSKNAIGSTPRQAQSGSFSDNARLQQCSQAPNLSSKPAAR